jgi:hypothetical protein
MAIEMPADPEQALKVALSSRFEHRGDFHFSSDNLRTSTSFLAS